MHKHYQVKKNGRFAFLYSFHNIAIDYGITCTAPNTVLYWFREAIGISVLKSQEAAEAF